MFDTMKKLFVVNNAETVETETKTNVTREDKFLARLFEITNGNAQKIGGKVYAEIPVELLMIDESYQRVTTYNKDRVAKLTTQFDTNKMDTLVVSVHEEEKRYYIVDGMHRYLAAINRELKSLPCEIKHFSGTTEERQKEEAKYFINQYILTDPLSPIDQHKGRVLINEQAYVILDNAVNARKEIHLKDNRNKGRQKPGTITGYRAAVRIAERNEKLLNDVFDALIGANWHLVGTGLSDYSLRMVADVLAAHDDKSDEVKAEIAKILRQIEPKLFRAVAQGKYVMRTQGSANALYLEDLVCTNLGIKRLIDTDIPRYNPVTETMEPVA